MTACIADDDPCLFIQHSGILFRRSASPESLTPVRIGQADVKRVGTDVSIITYGPSVHDALAAADALAELGVSAEVVDLRSVVPLDIETVLQSVAKTRRAIVVHAATKFAGPGAEIAAQINESLFGELERPVVRLGAEFVPIPFAAELDPLPSKHGIVDAARRLTDTLA